MEKTNLIAMYVDYCNDLNINYFKANSKHKFSNDYTEYLYNLGKIQLLEIEDTNKDIFNTLKYNTLSIKKVSKNYDNRFKKCNM